MINNYAVTPKSLFHLFICIFFVKDPCKKCLITACCSKLCGDKINYLRYCDREGDINWQRFLAACVTFSILTILYGIIESIIYSFI